MPIHNGYDEVKKKWFVQWGDQKKYYYNIDSQISTTKAYNKAVNQMKAIKSEIRSRS